METSVRALSSRVRIQAALGRYNLGNNTAANWEDAASDLGNAISGASASGLLTQVIVFPQNDTGLGNPNGVLNVTSSASAGLPLPYNYDNGSSVLLGDAGLGYPPNLYPNLTYTSTVVNSTYNAPLARFDGQTLGPGQALLLGPWQLNSTFALTSITIPIINNTSATAILGWMTVVLDARLLFDVLESPVGLESSGTALLIGPATVNNRFAGNLSAGSVPFNTTREVLHQTAVKFVLPPVENYPTSRHSQRLGSNSTIPFNLTSYNAASTALTNDSGNINNAGSTTSTRNEQGIRVAVGYAVLATDLAAWIILVEEAFDEAYEPIHHLRDVLLACVFGTAGTMLLLVFPFAHYASLPIRRLRQATRDSVDSPGYGLDDHYDEALIPGARIAGSQEKTHENVTSSEMRSTSSGSAGCFGYFGRNHSSANVIARTAQGSARHFRIPRKVHDGRHIVYDELTDLTETFNDMADELMMQYSRLEERVQQRTAELELSKKAAEAANESKTLFIANISHELKTPLNGILGMCAVAMQEDDPSRIKRSLGIIYKSGDLLHNLLTDLLTFSKNQVGQQISLDEKGFRMSDIESQLHAIFETQAHEGKIDYTIKYEGPCDASGSTVSSLDKVYGPPGTGRVKDMFLWGDYHRILQVIINLVSNSLKFTPKGGSVTLTIRCTGSIIEAVPATRKESATSMQSKSSEAPANCTSQIRSRSRVNTTLPSVSKVASVKDFPQKMHRNHSQTTISSEMVGLPPDAPSLGFEFEVLDTGPGIPPYLQESIFLPFVQGDLRLTKKFGGTGLGLSICSQLAKLMHGAIGLESEEGVGSKFTFKVPLTYIKARADSFASSQVADHSPVDATTSRRSSLQTGRSSIKTSEKFDHTETTTSAMHNHFDADHKPRLVGLSQPFFSTSEPSMASPLEQNPAKKVKRLRVLVAEDNKVNQEVMLRMLRLEEVFDVHVAKDGQEAYDMVKQSMEQNDKYDMIFMDVQVSFPAQS